MNTSYAAGFRDQLRSPEMLAIAPYWRYVHSDSVVHPRPEHLAWDGLTLPYDDPFWDTHSPPNGWGCQCRITPVTADEYVQSEYTAPPEGWDAIDPETGAPPGIDPGWDYAPGAGADDELRSFVQDKLIDYPPAIERALTLDVNRYIDAQTPAPEFVRRAQEDRQMKDVLWLGFVEDVPRVAQETGIAARGYTVLLPADGARHVELAHGADAGNQRPPRPEDYGRLMDVLNQADTLTPSGTTGPNGERRMLASKLIDGELYQTVFEARASKKNRALALVSLWIKLSGQ
jgi:hypothetical protein